MSVAVDEVDIRGRPAADAGTSAGDRRDAPQLAARASIIGAGVSGITAAKALKATRNTCPTNFRTDVDFRECAGELARNLQRAS